VPSTDAVPLPENSTVGVVVLAWQDEPWLAECVDAVLASTGVDVQLVIVDNGCTRTDLGVLADRPGATMLRPNENAGFAGGCTLGAATVTAEFLALVNSDCILAPDALAQLVDEARLPGVGPVMASVRLADRPELINSAGNPVHVLGVSWAGGMDEPETRTVPFDVAGASGAALLLRRELWERLDGFDEAYFAYLEDTELSLRCARLGLRARCVPTAVAAHHYEFSRNSTKMYLLERNRLMLLATMWPARALVLLLPLLCVLELGISAQAVAQGWGRQKARGWVWLWRNRSHVRERRAQLQSEATVSDADWMRVLTAQLDDRVIGSPAATRVLNSLVGGYWSVVRRLL
jgi:GT2 family glycosyltransferase